MRQHQELQYTTVGELANLLRTNGAQTLVQNIYKYTANIHGSDPYWFQRRRELMAQAEQQRLRGTLFWTFSAADNHWKDLMAILGVPEDAGIAVRRKVVNQNPHVVNFYFCRRIEKAVTITSTILL